MTDLDYVELLSAWGIEFAGTDKSALVEGSPERVAARTVVRDRSGGRWILEEIERGNLLRKEEIAEQLETLSALEHIHSYCRTKDGSFFQNNRMLRPYIEGAPLPRPGWLEDSWRIEELAGFLVQLREKTADWSGPVFSIASYAENRMADWRKTYSKLAEKLELSFGRLQKNFFPVHDRLPTAFCHGDYHPLNIVWGEQGFRSVIDWEFCGIKPELYDVALLLGCIGFEDPDNLIKEPAIRLVQTLRAAGFGEDFSWEHLLDLMAVIRYGWMSEWIRRSDREARQMEAVYIDILVDQQEYIQQRWP